LGREKMVERCGKNSFLLDENLQQLEKEEEEEEEEEEEKETKAATKVVAVASLASALLCSSLRLPKVGGMILNLPCCRRKEREREEVCSYTPKKRGGKTLFLSL